MKYFISNNNKKVTATTTKTIVNGLSLWDILVVAYPNNRSVCQLNFVEIDFLQHVTCKTFASGTLKF